MTSITQGEEDLRLVVTMGKEVKNHSFGDLENLGAEIVKFKPLR